MKKTIQDLAVSLSSLIIVGILTPFAWDPFANISNGIVKTVVGVVYLFLLASVVLALFAGEENLRRLFGKEVLFLVGRKRLSISGAISTLIVMVCIYVYYHYAANYAALRDFYSMYCLFVSLLGIVFFLTLLSSFNVRYDRFVNAPATTSTAYIFREQAKHQIALIENKTYGWLLPPGGHFSWELGENPFDTALQRMRTEAGLSAEPLGKSSRQTASDQGRIDCPDLLFWLEVPKSYCHTKHLDFAFVFKDARVLRNSRKPKAFWLDIARTDNEAAVEVKLRNMAKDKGIKPRLTDATFPADLPERILSAHKLFCQELPK